MTSIEEAGPLPSVSGLKVEMRLDEHSYRKKFSATLVGPVLVANEPYFDGMHLLKLDSGAAEKLSVGYLLFLPQGYRFHRGIPFRKERAPRPNEPYRASLERFLVSRNPAIRAIEGRVYATSHEKRLMETMRFQSKHEFSLLSYGIIARPKTVSE